MPLTFQLNNHKKGELEPTDEGLSQKLTEKLAKTLEQLENQSIAPKKAAQKIAELVAKHSHFFQGHAFLAELFLDMDDLQAAQECHVKGYEAGCSFLPPNFKGPLSWQNLEARAFLCCYNGYVESLLSAGEFSEALAATNDLLIFNPEDSFGRLYELGELLILGGKLEEAEDFLKKDAAKRPVANYSLAWLALKNGEFDKAAAFLRRGFISAPYAGEALTGRQVLEPYYFWDKGPEPADFYDEQAYADFLGGNLWQSVDVAVSFINWFHRTSTALKDRAEAAAIAERFLNAPKEADSKKAADDFKTLKRGLTAASSKKMVASVKDPASGQDIKPWELAAIFEDEFEGLDEDGECQCGCGCEDSAEDGECQCGCGCEDSAEDGECQCGCGCEDSEIKESRPTETKKKSAKPKKIKK